MRTLTVKQAASIRAEMETYLRWRKASTISALRHWLDVDAYFDLVRVHMISSEKALYMSSLEFSDRDLMRML